jgi:SOS response regulatory protein OraA/RecX
MLGRRELSEQQVRQRLARKDYGQDDIDEAIARLREQRAIDDRRVAEAIVRTETGIRKRGRVRVRLHPDGDRKSGHRQRVRRDRR